MTNKKDRTVGIICAMEKEFKLLEEAMTVEERKTCSGIEFLSGKLEGVPVVAAVSGVGKVFAAVCTEIMILMYHPDCILNSGVAGAIQGSLHIGDIAVADRVVQHDMDTSAVGDPVGLISGINKIYIESSGEMVRLLMQCVEDQGIHAVAGTIASGDLFVHTAQQREEIVKRFDAIACEMEGAAIGQVCYINDVDFGILRAISDEGNTASAMDYPTFVRKAAKTAAEITRDFLRRIS